MPKWKKQQGLTLIEMMVALAVGLIVTAAITAVFIQTRQNTSQDENTARMQENARFAINILRNDLLHADFWADFTDGAAQIGLGSGLAPNADCSDGSTSWLFNIGAPEKRLGYLNNVTPTTANAAYNCIPTTGTDAFRDNTDVLALQRARGMPTTAPGTPDDTTYMRASLSQATLFFYKAGVTPPTIANAHDWEFLAHIYYVGDDSVLYRYRLQSVSSVPSMVREPLVDGIQQFHVEFGIDTDNNGTADYYTSSPGTDIVSAVSARIFVLARSPQADMAYKDTKTYPMGHQAAVGPFDDGFLRRVYTTTVTLKNFNYRAGVGTR